MSAAQGSAEWLFERVGLVTASRFKDVIATLKDGRPAKAREDYMWEIVIERITGKPSEHFTSAAMEWGSEQEVFSRMAYEAKAGVMVEEVGLIKHPEIEGVAGSPDGLIGDDGGWESKSPYNSAVHLLTMIDGMPDSHIPQVQGLMWITGRKWWDFTSYDSRMPAPLDLYIQRIERDDKFITSLAADVKSFLGSVSAMQQRFAEMVASLK